MSFSPQKWVSNTASSVVRKLLYLCLALFPMIIVYAELSRFFELEHDEGRRRLFRISGRELLKLSENADNARFFHLVLKREFSDIKDNDSITENELKNRVDRLKKTFPGVFSFIFWNKKGAVISSLSDDRRYSYLSKKLNRMLGAIRADTLAGRNVEAGFSGQYEDELRLLRNFLGPFVTIDGLTTPFLQTSAASCFQLHARGDRTLGWYEKSKKFAVLVFISEKVRNELVGPKFLCRNLNEKWPEISFYLLDEHELKVLPASGEDITNDILLNYGKFRKMAPKEYLESKNHFFDFQKLDERWWGVAAIDKSAIVSVESRFCLFFARFFAIIFVSLFILYCYLMVHKNPLVSVRSKLIIVFAYTVFIPALVFGVVAFDYLKQKETQTLSDASSESFQMLTSIDSQFDGYLHGQALKLNSLIAGLFNGKSIKEVHNLAASAGTCIVSQFSPDTLIFADSSGTDILNAEYSKTIKADILRKTAAKELIRYLNSGKSSFRRPSEGLAEGFLLSFPLNYKRFLPFTLSKTTFLSYLYPLANDVEGRFSHLIQLFWLEKDMYFSFFKEMERRFENEKHKRLLVSFSDSGLFWPEDYDLSSLPGFFDKVRLHGSASELVRDKSGKAWLAVGQNSSSLRSAILTVLIAHNVLVKDIHRLKKGIWSLIAFSAFVTLSLYYILVYYLLTPIKALAKGVEMVKNKNYSYRIDMNLSNEFGRLSRSVDASLENLQELEIAKKVQESLLPQNSLELENFSVVGRTRSMTSLGGDYYDFVVDDMQDAVVLMADVAGHGVQAGLLMAMAKSVLLLNDSFCRLPETIMSALNKTFCTLRKSNITTMMTGQIVSILRTGELNLLNAGHCSPLVVTSGGDKVRFVSCPALPFGFSQKRKFKPLPVEFLPGDTMVLYSDGILECTNQRGEALGEDGFAELTKKCYDSDSNRYIDRLFAEYDCWTDSQQDDITFVLVRRKEN